MGILNLLKKKRIETVRKLCKHDFEKGYEKNSAKRRCRKCGRVEWAMSRRFPSFDEPSLKWKFMYYVDDDGNREYAEYP